MRLVTDSDDDEVLSGKKDPALPDTSRHPSSYVERALRLVRDEIERAVGCPRCRSQHVKDRSAPGPRGATWRLKECSDCGLAYDIELDA